LIPVECDTKGIHEGDRLILRLDEGAVLVRNETMGQELVGNPFPAIMLDLLTAGGLVPYFKIHHDFVS